MNRSDHYMKQLTGMAKWFRAQGDDEGAALAQELGDRLQSRHEAVDDQTSPEWTSGEDAEIDVEPNIRCTPSVGVVFRNHAGELILTIDMLDGGDVAVVHLGDAARYVEGYTAPAEERPTEASGEIIDAEFADDTAEEQEVDFDEEADLRDGGGTINRTGGL